MYIVTTSAKRGRDWRIVGFVFYDKLENAIYESTHYGFLPWLNVKKEWVTKYPKALVFEDMFIFEWQRVSIKIELAESEESKDAGVARESIYLGEIDDGQWRGHRDE